jgi:hypothetical protein
MYLGTFRDIIAPKNNFIICGIRPFVLLSVRRGLLPLDFRNICDLGIEGQNVSAINLSDKSRNLSLYITEYGSSEKFEILLEKC